MKNILLKSMTSMTVEREENDAFMVRQKVSKVFHRLLSHPARGLSVTLVITVIQ